ncbi:MAG: ABC transporter permease [Burkholderiales bacterium]
MTHELRHALRLLWRAPGFTALAVGTLALGIAASTAIFSLADAVVLAPLPYADPGRRVMVWNRWRGFDKTWVNPAEMRTYGERCPSLARVANWSIDPQNLTGDGEAARVNVGFISANGFAVLGARPLLGRGITPEEDRAGGPRVAVLGHALWQGRYGGDPGVIGRGIELDGVPHEVIGVMPPGFALPTDFTEDAAEPTQVWVPRAPDEDDLTQFGNHGDYGAGELARGASVARATEELRAATRQLTAEGKYDPRIEHGAFAVSLPDEILGAHRPAVAVTAGAAILLLLIACANVASLLLARGAARQRELGLRAAVGGGRGRLVAQQLVEGLALAALAAAIGLPLAAATLRVMGATVTANVPRAALASVDPRAVAFALLLAAATTLLFALVPALQSSQLDVSGALREGGPRTAGGASHRRWRLGVVVAQAAFAALLAVGAVLMAKTLGSLTRIDVGFQPKGVLTQRLSLPRGAYPEAPDVIRFYRSLLDETRALPGVTSAGLLRSLPLGESIGDWGISVEGYDAQGLGTSADWQVASDGASETLGERLVSGRFLARGDDEYAADVAVVNEAMARKYWSGQDAVGQRFRIGPPSRPSVTVVGVVGDVRHNGITGIVKPKFYRPHAQFHRSRGGTPTRDMALVVKTDGDPLALAGPIRDVVRRLDPAVPVSRVRTLDAVVASSIVAPRLASLVLGLFAVLAVLLCAVGVYGVLAMGVAERRQEIGVRLALGAPAASVGRLVLGEGLVAVGCGLAIGLVAAAMLSRFLVALLSGVRPLDPGSYLLVAVALAAVAVVSGLVPALRAARTDPAIALRSR